MPLALLFILFPYISPNKSNCSQAKASSHDVWLCGCISFNYSSFLNRFEPMVSQVYDFFRIASAYLGVFQAVIFVYSDS